MKHISIMLKDRKTSYSSKTVYRLADTYDNFAVDCGVFVLCYNFMY